MNKNYIPLYRKYRPQTLEQIVGQSHIKKALSNAIQTDRISHAYLFTGPRGTGKTSTARIFAKSLNCKNGPTVAPCNECENCVNITNSVPIDVIEIDAASNRSVNDADDIIQKVALAPVHSRYKIYIIDEVHMLTPQAFNALLKTLEEPPENVIFILATTEVHKVLDTIKSRCQRFDFKRITTEDIAKHLRYISDKENINITDDALSYIAQNSAGGMRDSIALLDQLSVLNSIDEAISVDDINKLLGRLSFEFLNSLFVKIANSDQNGALEILNSIYDQGNEPVQILSNFLEYLRNVLVIKSVGASDSAKIVQINESQISIAVKSVENIEVHQIVALTDKCANYIKELKLTSNPKLWLDIAVLDMANLAQNTKLSDLQSRLFALEGGEAPKMVNVSAYNTPPSPVFKQPLQTPQPSVKSADKIEQPQQNVSEITKQPANESISSPVNTNNIDSLWNKFLDSISSIPTRAILSQQGFPIVIKPDEVIIAVKSENWLKKFTQEDNYHKSIAAAAKAIFNTEPKLTLRSPQAGDAKLKKEQSFSSDTQQVEESVPPKVLNFNPSTEDEFVDEKVNTITPKMETRPDSSFHSDNVNMVMDLFEGKLIE
ncbi:DNA polymerase III subunit gamma/tau [bacterium]|nr:DNA polymerase III subunit gamma/tau [bacterium]